VVPPPWFYCDFYDPEISKSHSHFCNFVLTHTAAVAAINIARNLAVIVIKIANDRKLKINLKVHLRPRLIWQN